MNRREFFGVSAGIAVIAATGSAEYLTPLTVENVEALCDKMLPAANKGRPLDGWVENYANLITYLHKCGIKSLGTLANVIRDNLPSVLAEDKEIANKPCRNVQSRRNVRSRRGVFLLHVGLVRKCVQRTNKIEFVRGF